MTTDKKENRGGARPNAGVKVNPLVGKRIKVATTITPKHFDLIQKEGKPLSRIIEAALNVYFGDSEYSTQIEK